MLNNNKIPMRKTGRLGQYNFEVPCFLWCPSMRELLEPPLSIALDIRESPNVKAPLNIKLEARVKLVKQINSRQAVTKWPWLRFNKRASPAPRCYARTETGQKTLSSSILSSGYRAFRHIFCLRFDLCFACRLRARSDENRGKGSEEER